MNFSLLITIFSFFNENKQKIEAKGQNEDKKVEPKTIVFNINIIKDTLT